MKNKSTECSDIILAKSTLINHSINFNYYKHRQLGIEQVFTYPDMLS